MKKLKTILFYSSSNIIYVSIFLTLTLLVQKNFLYLLILFIYLKWFLKHHKKLIVFSLLLSLLINTSYFLQINKVSKIEGNVLVGEIVDIPINKENMSFTLYSKGEYIKIFLRDIIDLKPGDVVEITGDSQIPKDNTIPNLFNYNDYLKTKRIYTVFYGEKINLIDTKFNINIFRYNLIKHIENSYSDKSSNYIKALFVGYKYDIDEQTYSLIENQGITHLFAISGLHITILILIISYMLKRIMIPVEIVDYILVFLILLYLIITGFQPSILRSGIMFIIYVVNKKLRLYLSLLDVISCTYIFLLVLNPGYIDDLGFRLSFVVTYSLALSSKLITNKNRFLQIIIVSLIAQLSTLPFLLNVNYEINILTTFYNFVFIIYLTYIFLPFTLLTIILPIFDNIYLEIINIFEILVKLFSNFEFKLPLNFESHIFFIVYYLIIFKLFLSFEINKNRIKYVVIFILFITFVYNIRLFDFSESVIMLDVGQGDSLFIKGKNNSCNILIDTGEKDKRNRVVNYLKGKNIHHLDYLIITHSHSDHIGEFYDILSEINVKRVVMSDFEKRLNLENISYLKSNDKIKCGDISLDVLSPQENSENLNNISLTLMGEIGNDIWMFTGDIESEVESEITNKINYKVNILKVAHHGSDTSTTKKFLDKTNLDIALISVGEKNKYSHPSTVIINRLVEYNISTYCTDEVGSIKYSYYFNKFRILKTFKSYNR